MFSRISRMSRRKASCVCGVGGWISHSFIFRRTLRKSSCSLAPYFLQTAERVSSGPVKRPLRKKGRSCCQARRKSSGHPSVLMGANSSLTWLSRMPGSVLYDFGDMVRTMTSPAAEDEENLDKTFLRMPMFEAVVKGYLEAARDFITPQEVSKLAFSGLLITLETGIRFLTDYLEGDVYFKTKKERHNLHRARTQLRLVESMEEQMPEMEECVRKCFQTVNG